MAAATQELEQSAENFNGAVPSFEEVEADPSENELSGDHEELSAHADARRDIRRKVDKVELRLAFRDLAEGVRGLIRVKPLTAVLAGVLVGAALSRRSKTRRPVRR